MKKDAFWAVLVVTGLAVCAALAILALASYLCGCKMRSEYEVNGERFGYQTSVSGLEDESENNGKAMEADPQSPEAEKARLEKQIEFARLKKARAKSVEEAKIWEDAMVVSSDRIAQIDAAQPKKAGGGQAKKADQSDKSAAVTAAPEPSWFGMKKNAGPIVFLALMFLGWGLFVFALKDANETWGAAGPPVVAVLWVLAAATGTWLLDAPMGGVYAGRALLSSACWAAVSLVAYRPGVESMGWRITFVVVFAFLGWGFLPTAAS